MRVQRGSEVAPGSTLVLPDASRESVMFDEPWQTMSVLYQSLPYVLSLSLYPSSMFW